MVPTSADQADAWAAAPWAVVTRSGILQARCGRPATGKPPTACIARRLSSPGGVSWKPCYACGSAAVSVPIEAAGTEAVAEAIARATGS
jgi:hypothetical protein